MDIKETRGRKPLYEYKLKLRQVVTFPYSKSAQVSVVSKAKRMGQKVRTWTENDILFVKRIQ